MTFSNNIRLLLLGVTLLASQYSAAMDINFIFVGDKSSTAYLGAKQGLDEANLQGQFLGQNYTMNAVASAQLEQQNLEGISAILTAVDSGNTFTSIANANPDMPVFNLSLKDDELRTACIPNALHTISSRRMQQDAVQQYQQKKPGSAAIAQAWHPDFVKFAARDLNKRYKKSAGIPMDDAAWSGWAAVKLTSDTVARTQSAEPKELLQFFKTSLKFDGQKGSDMNFRETGQLRQLMLLVENNEIVAEAPVRGIASSLDSLGILTCEK